MLVKWNATDEFRYSVGIIQCYCIKCLFPENRRGGDRFTWMMRTAGVVYFTLMNEFLIQKSSSEINYLLEVTLLCFYLHKISTAYNHDISGSQRVAARKDYRISEVKMKFRFSLTIIARMHHKHKFQYPLPQLTISV